jgi:hypothetical protein
MASRTILASRIVAITHVAGLLRPNTHQERDGEAPWSVMLAFGTLATLVGVAAYFSFRYLLR